MIKGTALSSVKLRLGPGTSYEEYTQLSLKAGDSVEANRNVNQWLEISKIDNVPVEVEIWASAGTAQQYIKWWVESEPSPNPTDPPPDNQTEYILYVKDGITRKFVPQ